jgi:glycosyltransferase involved in cell wall biosynthesis
MRVAFLTPEYPSELPDAGGLATYVWRMTQLLREFGHEPEVFVTSRYNSTTIFYDGVPVHRVGRQLTPKGLYLVARSSQKLIPSYTWHALTNLVLDSVVLARALEQRHAKAPFDLIQSSDYRATGLFVRRRAGRVHAVRCSSATDLWGAYDQRRTIFDVARGYLERRTMRRANVAYSPSSFLADYFRRVHGMDVVVIRPPAHIMSSQLPLEFALPDRYFIHFGLFIRRKGTDVLARALPIAWKRAPDLTMVWSGVCWDQQKLKEWQRLWGNRADLVQITGPLPRDQLYTVLQGAAAAVLPSLADNLPNTVIESLSLGIPVIGTRGASIDELVEEGKTGHLVDIEDVDGLADTLANMWLQQSSVAKGFKWQSPIATEMKPERAVQNLLNVAREIA